MIDKELVKTCTEFPGIYLIRNSVNGKCYVGQAINLKKRLRSHINNCDQNRYDNPLYRAVHKYGWEVFEYTILEILETTDFRQARKDLDILEVKYINEYNSYKEGYNQTLGGDGGILGYKMTPEQIQKIKDNHVELNAKPCVLYNLETKEYLDFESISEAARFLECCPQNVSRRCSGERLIPLKGYVIKYTKEEIEDFLKEGFKAGPSKFTKEEIIQLLEDNPISNTNEIVKLGICKKTFYNYLKEYDIPSPFIERIKIDYYCVLDTQTDIYYKCNSVVELSEYFGITQKSARKLACSKKDGSLYKRRYIIYTIPQYNYFTEAGQYGVHYWTNTSGKVIATNAPTKELLFRLVANANEWTKQ